MLKILGAITSFLFKMLLSIVFYATPVLGFWLASSLAAHLGAPSWMAWTAGALLFPILPGLWELHFTSRRKSTGKPLLTWFDRLSLRTFAIGLVFIVVLLCVYPQTAFVSLSTRGDWMLDGVKDARADQARKILFTAAGGLQWLYDATRNNPYKSLIDPKARQIAEEATKQREQEDGNDDAKAKELDALLFRPTARSKQELAEEKKTKKDQLDSLLFEPKLAKKDSKDTSKEVTSAAMNPERIWPWTQTELHPAVANMPASVETSIKSVAKYIAKQERDPFLRIKALHDYVADRVAYDAKSFFAGDYPPQDAETTFKTRKSVCAGYANLLSALGDACGEKIVVVVGDARDDSAANKLSGMGHAWNAARINGKWYLIDATWDSGFVSREKGFSKKYRTDYLLVPPNVMISDHFPDESTWQLLSHPLTQGDFLRQPMLRPSFQIANLELLDPNRAQNETESSAVAVIKNPNKVWLMASLESNGRKTSSSDAYNSQTARIEFPLTDKGTYRMNMFINETSQYGQYDFVGSVDFVKR